MLFIRFLITSCKFIKDQLENLSFRLILKCIGVESLIKFRAHDIGIIFYLLLYPNCLKANVHSLCDFAICLLCT